ncbi:ABC-three component system protein [Bradyrhizobium sp. HKCCYLRH3083]|uniref:ABC-three component system protein n=1 Tax=unclassified Bradyrhizobium TaxID=2631580 RepID=UPI003EB6E36E
MSQVQTQTTRKTTAPGQYLGYSLQQLRLCHHLLRKKANYEVSLEFLDDIAVHTAGEPLLLEQCKSVTSTNALADRAVDLWKSLANWADLCKAGTVDANETVFRLYICPDGNPTLALELSSAKTIQAASEALKKVKKLLKKGKQAAAVDEHIARFLAVGDDINQAIIRNFELVIDNNPVESVKSLLHLSAVSDVVLDEIAAAAIGMARDRIDNLIFKKQTPIIGSSNFQTDIRAFIRKHNLANLLISKAPEPSPEHISSHLDAPPMFVRQLQSVEASSDLLTTAISDWLKANADKIYWANEGHVFVGSFQDFDAALIRKHKLVRDEVEDILSEKSAEQRGREVYRRCTQSAIPLEGNDLPDHFVAGSYNCLADEMKLGWHPQYTKLFPAEESV